ncbi:MAG: hypothetical protein HYS78_00010 [Parcubacteria group bacterium]|nr:hypothetical protein [Parcubacteria group bacterium]
MNKTLLIISIIVILGFAYWPLSLFREVKTFDKEFPGLREALGTMTPEQQQELIRQMETSKNILMEELDDSGML